VIGARGIALVTALAAIAVGTGLLVGYPAEVGAATTIAVAALVSLATTRDLAARADLRARPVRRVADSPPLEQLRRVARALTAAKSSGDLRPLFRPIALVRLARRGVDLDRHPEQARAILGEQLWELVRADPASGSNPVASGMSIAGLQSLIERLERI
jgi:hypothetical protein